MAQLEIILMERFPSAVRRMNPQLEHRMIKDGCLQLQQIGDKTHELNSLLSTALREDDDGTVQRDLEWAAALSVEVARDLLEFTGGAINTPWPTGSTDPRGQGPGRRRSPE
jgi:hypothetical protein